MLAPLLFPRGGGGNSGACFNTSLAPPEVKLRGGMNSHRAGFGQLKSSLEPTVNYGALSS